MISGGRMLYVFETTRGRVNCEHCHIWVSCHCTLVNGMKDKTDARFGHFYLHLSSLHLFKYNLGCLHILNTSSNICLFI